MNVNRREFIAASAVLGAAAALTPKLGGAGSWFGGAKAGDQALTGLQILRSAHVEAEGFEKGVSKALFTRAVAEYRALLGDANVIIDVDKLLPTPRSCWPFPTPATNRPAR